MTITPIPRHAIVAAWPELQAVLQPALDRDADADPERLHSDLTAGRAEAWFVAGGAEGIVVTSQGLSDDAPPRECLWVLYVAGRVPGGALFMRQIAVEFERIAHHRGCAELRAEPRVGWRRILRDYHVSAKPNGGLLLRKVL